MNTGSINCELLQLLPHIQGSLPWAAPDRVWATKGDNTATSWLISPFFDTTDWLTNRIPASSKHSSIFSVYHQARLEGAVL
jgi:hypothetical protein